MIEDDPFLKPTDAGPTVIRPMPGGRRGTGVQTPPPGPLPVQAPGPEPAGALPAVLTDNPLVACAVDLLSVAAELRGSVFHPDPEGLRKRLIQRVRDFEQCARSKGLDDRVVLPARYVLCALLDESVLDTPWGSQSVWAKQGLLIGFHNETWGGEKFYEALERLLAFPSGNLQLLELMYLCLALGFEGRYRVREGGREQLERVRERLYQAIRRERGEPEPALSPHWQGLAPKQDPLIQQVPLWVFGGIAGLILLGLFAAFTFALGRDSDPVYLALSALDKGVPAGPLRTVAPRPEPPPPVAPPPQVAPETPPPPKPTLRTLLAEDIAANRVEVQDRPLGETVIIRGDGLFASGRDTLQPAFLPVVTRIGEALHQLPGRVLITGHTDSAPIKTLKFPSNWHLSQARADSVKDLLVQVTGEPARFTAEGRADSEPRVPDNPRDARNRRVEITLTPPRLGTSTGQGGAGS